MVADPRMKHHLAVLNWGRCCRRTGLNLQNTSYVKIAILKNETKSKSESLKVARDKCSSKSGEKTKPREQ